MAVRATRRGNMFEDIWTSTKNDILNTANTTIPSTAKTLVRKDTAELAKSIEGRIEGNQQITSTNKEYASAQEFGLAEKGKPNYGYTPYLRPALLKFADRLGQIFIRAITRAL